MTIPRFLVSLLLITPAVTAAPQAHYGQFPFTFERNQGQVDPAVRFLARGQQYTASIADDGIRLRLRAAPDRVVHLKFTDANSNTRFDAPDKLPGVSNYLIGNDPRRWIYSVPQYSKISQRNIYPGIDVAYHGNQGQLEYDFLVAPGADPDRIHLHISGASKLRLDANGDLLLDVNGQQLRQKLPAAWQDRDASRTPIAVHYRLLDNDTVAFSVAQFDRTQPLVIDPVLNLVYSTYLGGSLADQANGIAVDYIGNAWIAGSTTSLDFPVTANPKPTNAGLSDAFVAKLDPSGTVLLVSTYIGGAGNDSANAIAVDPSGNAYITGSTSSTNFPTVAAMQSANVGGLDAFVVKLNPIGSVVYSTYIGGSSDDVANGIAVDANQFAYIAGYTSSINFPTATPQQAANRGGKDAFILKLNAAGTAPVYSTYFGGSSDDQANGIAVDSSGSAYIAGVTLSKDYPLTTPLQTFPAGGFVAKFDSSGATVYSTYLGGGGKQLPAFPITPSMFTDVANAIAVDSNGNAFVTGSTTSNIFPLVNAVQSVWSDGFVGSNEYPDAFLAKLNAAGSALVFSTYFGGSSTGIFAAVQPHPGGTDVAYGVAVDAAGNAYITGSTTTPAALEPTTTANFPLQDPFLGYTGPQPPDANGGGFHDWYHPDAFLASFSPTGSLLFSTDLGGLLDDVGKAVAVDTLGNAYITGFTSSTDFPLQSPLQSANPAACNPMVHPGCSTSEAFIAKFSFSTPGVRVFFGAALLNTGVLPTLPIVVTGTGCGAGTYQATTNANATLGTPFIWQPSASCTVQVQPAPAAAGSRYVFSSWSDGSVANPRAFTSPTHSATYTINVATQYQLFTSVLAAPGIAVPGSIVTTPTSPDGFFTTGTSVKVTALPALGNAFSNFTGDLVGTTNGQSITMNSAHSVTAVFVPSTTPLVAIEAPANGAAISGSAAITGWALDNTNASATAIAQVQVKVDGVFVGNATYGTPRADVCNTYPGRPGCPNVGYTFTLNANSLAPGTHTITVTATDSDATPDSGSASVTVNSTPIITGSKAAVFRNGVSFLADSNGNGVYDPGTDRYIPSFTPPAGAAAGDIPVVGDWTGDGHAKVGIYRPSAGTWWLDANNNGVFDAGDYTYQFGGVPGDIPVVGDWNSVQGVNTHKDCIGIYRAQGSVWLLDLNCNGAFENTPTDAFFPFGGLAGDIPVVGRWTGGNTQAGVVRKYAPGGVPEGYPFFWVLDAGTAMAGNLPANHPVQTANCFAFGGLTGDVFVVGDWYNTGTSQAGVYRNGTWLLDAAPPGSPQATHLPGFIFNYGGLAGDIPVPGKW